MFWSTAEPLYHLHTPPGSLDVAANTPEAARFALSTMFLHWSFTPYAIYTVPALLFALMHYNLGKPFSLGTLFVPLIGDRLIGRKGRALDALALFALVCGMASSLGTGAMTLAGGLDRFLGTGTGTDDAGSGDSGHRGLSFTASAASGLQKGIARLSAINAKAFFVFMAFVFAVWPDPDHSRLRHGSGWRVFQQFHAAKACSPVPLMVIRGRRAGASSTGPTGWHGHRFPPCSSARSPVAIPCVSSC
ncbi:BCCT family transporter [Cobetia sp. ICG0124]|uniref:BCCT family transporter n=1 Tax=Cobetia sp. ICG0124 TaxID=2053669 RepID=UPI0023EA5652|nr:BCCT family transporter [Cobetia sp. ICG0124]